MEGKIRQKSGNSEAEEDPRARNEALIRGMNQGQGGLLNDAIGVIYSARQQLGKFTDDLTEG